MNEVFLENIGCLLKMFAADALVNSSNYVRMCGRKRVTDNDLIFGLKYTAIKFFKEDEAAFAKRFREEFLLNDQESEEEEDERGEEEEEEEGEDAEEEVEEEEYDTDPLKTDMESVVSGWDEWCPEDLAEIFIKSHIDNL